ncbi:hypothetical protein IWX83_000047 [Flavobacterium sp. CG_9.1]|uniref:Uncharacterized protein n=1 Tax=Flavobacterium xanthum TaxID=69322 RepID=A0A1M7B3K8_9FLAO|nr:MULTISPECIES: hypothetical protein [Flavobacterium]MBG6060284.1 hypothetical protein [Flavobacterium sp. CG_9.1]SHL49562.1 hypothetical protein SAMN05443669_100865 [Flavobacterium xanthum]
MKRIYFGMTVNERLYVGGLSNDFDTCVKKKDVEGIKAILKKVELDQDTIVEIINSLELND